MEWKTLSLVIDYISGKSFTIRKSMYVIILFSFVSILFCMSGENNIQSVYAANQSVQYSYDGLGRVIMATYPDGTKFHYVYDANGNIVKVEKEEIQITDKSENTEQSGSTEQLGNEERPNNTEHSGDIQRPSNTEQSGDTGQIEIPEQPANTEQSEAIYPNEGAGGQSPVVTGNTNPELILHDTVKETQEYNKFKKKKPVIKSLKLVKKKNKRYLKIQIKQVEKRGTYGETGYQIKYATNSKFKKTKTVNVSRKKKGSITGKQWKVSKNKTYYVRVRAYLKTRTGKKIYTKYSKVKKINIKN